jgi:hypothetical protein
MCTEQDTRGPVTISARYMLHGSCCRWVTSLSWQFSKITWPLTTPRWLTISNNWSLQGSTDSSIPVCLVLGDRTQKQRVRRGRETDDKGGDPEPSPSACTDDLKQLTGEAASYRLAHNRRVHVCQFANRVWCEIECHKSSIGVDKATLAHFPILTNMNYTPAFTNTPIVSLIL